MRKWLACVALCFSWLSLPSLVEAQELRHVEVGRETRLEIATDGIGVRVLGRTIDSLRVRTPPGIAEPRITESAAVIRIEKSIDTREVLEIECPHWMPVYAEVRGADIVIRAVSAPIEIEAAGGSIEVHGARERVSALVVGDGGVVIEDSWGFVEAHALSQAVRLRRIRGEVVASNVSAAITFDEVSASRVRSENISGQTEFRGDLAPDGSHRFSSHTGAILLFLPVETDATIRALTSRESFSITGFEEARRGEAGTDQQLVRLGSGRGRIEITNLRGAVRIRAGS